MAARVVDVFSAAGGGQRPALRVAHHFSGNGTEEALELYRWSVPSELTAEPVTFLTVNAAVAETRDEATALILPNLHMMARLRTGQPLGPLQLVEEIDGAELTPQQQHIVDSGLSRAVVGSPAEAAEQLTALAQRFGVDEVMVHPVASAHRGTDPRTATAREMTLELLAKELFLGGHQDDDRMGRDVFS